ncbi:hypothetical protein E2542_SST16282 [Spatholobus suberectus]|nr:hypothetical protein E2542_SST16282 [Spatholobus suberectus]
MGCSSSNLLYQEFATIMSLSPPPPTACPHLRIPFHASLPLASPLAPSSLFEPIPFHSKHDVINFWELMSGLFFVIETIKTPSPCGLRQNPCFRSSFVANNEKATTSHHQPNRG